METRLIHRLGLLFALGSVVMHLCGCKEDLCRGKPPAFQLDLVVGSGVAGSRIDSVVLDITIASNQKQRTVDAAGLLDDGRTSVAVDVGSSGRGGFSAHVEARARDSGGAVIGTGVGDFEGSGDACNFFSLTLSKATADGGVDASDLDVSPATCIWSKRFGANENDRGRGVAAAGDRVFAIGSFQGTVDFGSGPRTAAGSSDVFVAAFAPAGDALWNKRFGGSGIEVGWAIEATDKAVYLTGMFRGTLDLGGTPLTSGGQVDVFVAGLTHTGSHSWSRGFGGGVDDTPGAVAVASDSTVYTTWSIEDSGETDVVLERVDGDGTGGWSKRFGAEFNDSGTAVVVDGSGNVYVLGTFRGSVDFGGGAIDSSGTVNVFIASYTPGGAHRWSRQLEGDELDDAGALAVDDGGHLYVTGCHVGQIDLGGGSQQPAGGGDLFLASYSTADGSYRWGRTAGNSGFDCGQGIAVGPHGDIFVTGYADGAVDFGGGAHACGVDNVFVSSYREGGAHRWSRCYGGDEIDRAYGVAADEGGVYVTGGFHGQIDFGCGTLVSKGDADVFLVKLAP